MNGMTHALVETPDGMLLISVYDESVLVLARTVPRDIVLSPGAVAAYLSEGGIYIVTFAAYPGDMHAVRIPPGWKGEPVGAQHVVRRAEAALAVGEPLLDLCCDIAAEFSRVSFVAWQRQADQRRDALRALLTQTTPGEA
jgi:hypothetical protein